MSCLPQSSIQSYLEVDEESCAYSGNLLEQLYPPVNVYQQILSYYASESFVRANNREELAAVDTAC